MNLDLTRTLAYLPGVRFFLQQQQWELRQGRSVLGVMGRHEHAEILWELCRDHLLRTPLDVESVDLREQGAAHDPATFLSEALFLNPSLDATLDPLRALMVSDLPEVIILQGLQEMNGNKLAQWLSFIVEWAVTATAVASPASPRPPALWGICSPAPDEEIPPEDAWLRVQRWWAMPSGLDMRLLCRLNEGYDHTELEPLTSWREAVLPALSGSDLSLAEHLWHAVDQTLDGIMVELRQFASRRGWTRDLLERWGVHDFLRRRGNGPRRFRLKPIHHERELWLRGILQQTPENGLQVSPAVLAVLEEREQVEHLLWRGQASLLLPLIDELRLSICDEFTYQYGRDWPLLWATPTTEEACRRVKENPMAVEWGHLKEAVRCAPYSDVSHRFALVSHVWYMRNKLAHYEPVLFTDYSKFIHLLG